MYSLPAGVLDFAKIVQPLVYELKEYGLAVVYSKLFADSMNVNNNTITLKTAVATSQVSAIECSAGSTGSGNTININNNTIT